MTSINNSDRASRVAIAISQYGDDADESNLIDLLADAMHWSRQYGHDFERCLRLAQDHIHAETHSEK